MKTPIFKFSESIDPSIISLLENTEWGTKKNLYYWKNIKDIIDPLGRAYCFSYFLENEPIACALINRKPIWIQNNAVDTYYGSHMAVSPKYKGQGFMKSLVKKTQDYLVNNLKRSGIEYAYFEAKNIRHVPFFLQRGSQCIGDFHVFGYSRFFPKEDSRAEALKEEYRSLMVQLLKQSYHDHSFTDFEISLLPEYYYIIREGDEIVAGVQFCFYHWVIERLAGLGGWVGMKILPHLPLLKSLFNPKNLRFLRFGNLYAKKGHERDLILLMNTLLVRNGIKTGIVCLDKRSPIYHRIRSQGFGIINKLIESRMKIFVTLHGVGTNIIETLKKQPFHVSMIDQ